MRPPLDQPHQHPALAHSQHPALRDTYILLNDVNLGLPLKQVIDQQLAVHGDQEVVGVEGQVQGLSTQGESVDWL